ncbi:MAG: poly-gamma-glutamate synthase PgsB [Corynebacterium sp.]|nr:poly-gamma-glutamate synthase PgsB [Corynebacterium sp.]
MYLFTALSAAAAVGSMVYFKKNEDKHNERLKSLDVNVHVNGIRGKSTVTRMVGGVFRAAGLNTIAKTTGTYACVIDAAGNEHPIQRFGNPNIQEQYQIIERWVQPEIQALVVECMAVKPEYQAICQDVIIKSPISIITNVRLDHQEELGQTLPEIARSLCRTVPQEGVLITGETNPELCAVMEEECRKRNAKLIIANADNEAQALVPSFDYLQFSENVAIVFALSDYLGIPRDIAVRGMLSAAPDPGTTRLTHLHMSMNTDLIWIPMFAVNDKESSIKIFHDLVESKLPAGCKKVIALNNRSDRTDRANLFLDILNIELAGQFDRVVLYGDLQEIAYSKLIDGGLPAPMIRTAHGLDVNDGASLINLNLQEFAGETVAVFGMGNIHTPEVVAMQRYIDAIVAAFKYGNKVGVL